MTFRPRPWLRGFYGWFKHPTRPHVLRVRHSTHGDGCGWYKARNYDLQSITDTNIHEFLKKLVGHAHVCSGVRWSRHRVILFELQRRTEEGALLANWLRPPCKSRPVKCLWNCSGTTNSIFVNTWRNPRGTRSRSINSKISVVGVLITCIFRERVQ